MLNAAETKDLENLEEETNDRQQQQIFNMGTPRPHHSPLSDQQLIELAMQKVNELLSSFAPKPFVKAKESVHFHIRIWDNVK